MVINKTHGDVVINKTHGDVVINKTHGEVVEKVYAICTSNVLKK